VLNQVRQWMQHTTRERPVRDSLHSPARYWIQHQCRKRVRAPRKVILW